MRVRRRETALRFRLAGAGLVTIALIASGCATKPPPVRLTAFQVVSGSPTKTLAASTSKCLLTIQISGVPGIPGGSITAHGSGVLDYAHRSGELTMAIPIAGQRLSMITILEPGVMYLRVTTPAITGLPKAKPWLKLDIAALAKAKGIKVGDLPTGTLGSPSDVVKSLFGVSSSVQTLGTETVLGATTTHYIVNVDIAKAAAKLPASDRSSFKSAMAEIGVTTTTPVDVWVDASGRLRKMMFGVNIPGSPGNPTGTVLETVEFYDFGTPVHVVPPRPGQVSDLASVIASGSRLPGS